MKRKHFIIALMAMLSCFAFTAKAQTSVSSLDALKAALASTTNILVDGEIVVDEAIAIPAGTTVGGDGTLFVRTMVYVVSTENPYPGVSYNKTATKNGSISGTVGCNVAYEISLDGGETWFDDTTNGKAQAVTVKEDGTKSISTSFQSAFTSAKSGEIVHMLKDAHVQSTNSKKNNGPLRSYYGLILEGNGHTIYTDLESSGASNEYATIKFTSYLAGTGADVRPVLKNVTINSQNNSKADLDLVSGDVTFTVSLYNVNLLGKCQYATFPITSKSAIINNSNVKLYDSKIPSWDAGSAKLIEFYSGEYSLSFNTKCKVYGGTFSNNPSSYLADCAQVKQENGKYVVSYKAAEVKVEVTPSEEFTSSATEEEKAVANELAANTAVSNETLTLPVGVNNFTVQLTDIEATTEATTKVTFNVEPKDASGAKVSNPSEAITFRLPVPAAWSGKANVYHEGTLLGAYTINEENGAKYVEVSSDNFSEFAVEAIVPTDVEVATLAELQAALADNSNELPIIITETIVIPEGETVVLDLNGKTVTVPETTGKHIYALNNKGSLTLKDTKGNGSITARGIYNGYNGTSTDETVAGAKMTIESGKYIGMDTDGGAAIFNCAELVVNGGDFTGGVAAINNRKMGVATIKAGNYHGGNNYVIQNNGGQLTIDDATVDSGFGAVGNYSGTTVINDGTYLPTGRANNTCHVVYVAGAANVTINGGTFKMNYPEGSTPDSGSAVASYYNGTVVINGGSFTSHFDNVSPVELSNGATIKGGTYLTHSGNASNHTYIKNYLAENFELGADGTVAAKPVAEVNGVKYASFAEAVAAAQAGSEIKLLANIEGDITVPANVTLNGNDKTISGGILAEGDITFAGVTTAADFDAKVVNTAVNIPAGASLQLTGSARLVIGHGATFNITGTIEDAKTADKATLVPSLKIAAGASITGNGVTFNVNNAYIVANANTTSKNSNANGTLDFNINNSIWEQTGVLAFYVPTSGKDPVVNFDLKNSVLTTTSHLVFSVTKGEIVIDNSLVNQGTSRQIENRSTMTIKNGSVVNGAVATSSNAINPGTIIVDNATYAVTGEFSGAAEGTGTLVIKKGANVSVGSIKAGANVTVDAEGMAAGDEINFTANLSQFTGELSVINNDKLEAQIVNGKVVLAAKPVAKIGEQGYTTLEAAFAAATEGQTITMLDDATPALTSQRAITKAAVIDLGGKTMTLTEDDLYFGTTTFKNGTIVVNPSVKPSTAVFWMFANQTLTFDNVKIVATGVTGTYLIGLEGDNSDLNLLNGSEILVENTTALDLDIICVNGTNTCDIKVENSKVNVTNIDGRVFFRGNYTVKDSEVNLAGITKAGFRIEAGQTLSIEGTSKVNIEGEPRDGGIHMTDLSATYTKAETATVNATLKEITPVAVIGTQKFASLQAAVDAAILMTGDVTIEIMSGTYAQDINLTNAAVTAGNANARPNITFKPAAGADVTLAGTTTLGYRIQNVGASMWQGEVTFEGIKFNHAENGKHSLDIQDVKGITLLNCTVTGDGEYGIGSNGSNATPTAAFTNCTFENGAMQVLGQLSANLVIDGCTFDEFSVNAQGGAKPGLTIKNSTFNLTLTDAHVGESFYAVRSNANPINIQNTKVTVDSELSSVAADQAKWGLFWARKDGKDVQWNVASCEVNLTDAAMAQTELPLTKNDGTANAFQRIILTDLTSTSNNVADLIKRTEGCATVNGINYKDGERDFTGLVAKIGDEYYATISDAVAAVEDGGTITLIANETFTKNNRYNNGGWWDGLGYSGDKSFTIDLANFTISQDGALNDYLMWFKNDGAKANTITLKNGTLDAGTTAYCALATASSNVQKITVNLENIKVINNNSGGAALKIRGGSELNVKAGTIITGQNSYLGIEAVGKTTVVNIYEGAEIYQNGTSSYCGCLAGVSGNGTINVYGGKGQSKSGGFIAMTSGGTINIEGGEWTANTDGTYANGNKSVLVAQSDKGAKSIVNVTGGTFKGGYNCYGNKVGDAQINIKGGNFNSDPASYVAEDYIAVENNGVWSVVKAAAKIGEKAYATLEEAFKAATSGCTIEILSDVTVDYNWDARKTGAKFTVPVTINGNGKTIKFTASVNDNNYHAPFRFEADATVKNLTIDMSEVTDNRFRAISSKGNLTVDGCKFIGKDETLNCRAIIFGEGAGANVGNLAISITNSVFIYWKRGITDNENAQDVKTVTITGNKLTDAGVGVSAKETVTFTGNTVSGAYVNITSYTAGNKLAVTATGNTLEANTDAAYNVINAGGVVNAEGFKVVAKGNDFNGYTGTDRIWGEVWGNARESFVIKVLDANGNVMGTSSLNNIDGIIDGDVNVTWSILFNAPAPNPAAYWSMEWTTAPTLNNMPAKVELWVDGTKVSGGPVVLNGPDDLNKINVIVTDAEGKVTSCQTTVANALAAAKDGEIVNLLWKEGAAPLAMNGSVFGKNVTIKGTAKVDWNKGWLFVGRGGEGNATVTFDGANLTSASNSSSTGIHVSGREKNTTNKYDGTLVIKNSTIELDYLINRNAIELDNATLTVKNGFGIAGRPASETESAANAIATISLANNSKVVVNNHNGMGLGQAASVLEGLGVMNIDKTSAFETTQGFVVTANGTMNIAGNATVAGTLTNNGAIVLTDAAATLTSSECGNVTTSVQNSVVSYIDGKYTVGAAAAKFGDKYFATLAEAIAASTPETGWGGEVTLLKDVTLEGGYADAGEGLRIEKSVTINGAGYTIDCGTFTKGIRIYQNGDLASNVMFKHTNIVNNNAQGRCIDTRSGKINLMLNGGVNLTAHGTNSQPLTIGGSEAMTKVTISGGTIDAGTSGYAVICFVPVTNHINVQGNAVIKGLAAFYLKEGVTNTAIKLAQSTSIGTNVNSAASGDFGAIVIEGSNNAVRLENNSAVVKAVAADGAEMAAQAAFLFRGNNNTVGYYANANPQVITEGGQSYFVMAKENATGTKFVKNGEEMVPEALTRGYQFITVEDALRYTKNGETVKLLANAELDETYVNEKSLTLDLNGKTLSTAYVAGSTTNHLYAIHNNGELTITDSSDAKTGKISARGIFNYGAMTLENGTINAIDGNGGYGVRNYAGATFTMNGGTIATTLEDDNKVDKGGYDATTVRVDEGATFTMNGGELNNICDYTFAIDNYGTTTVKGGKATSVHTTVANYGTIYIEGGEFVCNGLEGITAHAVWAAEGTTNISGGTFDGKDNYNGFNVCAEAGANVEINGGEFLNVHSGSLYGEGTITVSAGTFFDKIDDARCVVGFQAVANKNGTYTVEYTGCRNAMTIDVAEYNNKYENTQELIVGTLTFKRTLNAGAWNAFFVPFEVPLDSLLEKYDVAYLNDASFYDDDENGSIERITVQYVKFTEAQKDKKLKLHANHPYRIRPKNAAAANMNLVLTDVELQTTEKDKRKVLRCGGVYTNIEWHGLYERSYATDFLDGNNENDRCYAENRSGQWQNIDAASVAPFRVMMVMTHSDEMPYTFDEEALSNVRTITLGEDEFDTTGIINIGSDKENSNLIFDLQGRRVLKPVKGTLYIINGKKVVY